MHDGRLIEGRSKAILLHFRYVISNGHASRRLHYIGTEMSLFTHSNYISFMHGRFRYHLSQYISHTDVSRRTIMQKYAFSPAFNTHLRCHLA
jgi:hypothetical protein